MTPSEAQLPRKLAAILLADVVGYSRLMGENEADTLLRLKAHQKDFIDPTIESFHGRIVKLMGDGMLVEFPSVVDAVACAVVIQDGMAERNNKVDDSRKIQFRIGINLGDVIVDGDDIHGDGVNISARLESLSPACGICISGSVYESIRNKLALDVEYLGEKEVKNIAQPIHAYSVQHTAGAKLPKPGAEVQSPSPLKWRLFSFLTVLLALFAMLAWLQPWQQNEEASDNKESQSVSISEKPSIAVLPFTNMSGDPEQEYFSDGISEDLITNLSHLKNLAVISRNSSFTYKGTNTKVQDIGKDLGVEYVLEGSIRKAGGRVRITAQLIDARTGYHLWAERFDRKLTDVFAVQDEITNRITTALSIHLSVDEQTQLKKKVTNSFDAYDLFLQGQRNFAENTEESLNEATALYKEAIYLDPEFSRAYGALAVTMTRLGILGYTGSLIETTERALVLAQKSVSIAPESPQALWALAYVNMIKKNYDEAIGALEKAISIAPNYAEGYGLLALIYSNLGRAEESIRLAKKGMSLNPFYTYEYPYNLGRSYYMLGNYNKAVKYLEEALDRNVANYQPRLYLAASYMRLGLQEDAEWQVAELSVLFPNTTVSHWENTLALSDIETRTRLFSDLRAAGMAD